jgi:hypothetical protein
MDQLRFKAEGFRAAVRCGESVFRGGRALAAYEHTLAVAVAVGRVPPPLPGGWARPHIRLGGAIPDMHAERRLLHKVVLPALRAALLPRRALLEWSDPAWCGPQQAPGAEDALMLHPRLQALDSGGAARTALAAGDSVLLYCLLLGERAGPVPAPRAAIRGDAGVAVRARVWAAGSAVEADGHTRVAGRERRAVAADVVLQGGEYTPTELVMALQHCLNSAKWDTGINQDVGGWNDAGGGGAGVVAAFRWELTVENNRVLVTLRAAAMLAFDLSFRLPGLARFLGFDSGGSVSAGSAAVVLVRSEPPVRYGSAAGGGWVWASEAAATAQLPTTDERRMLAGRHRVLSDPAWARLNATASSPALEAARACCLRQRGAEVLVLRRGAAFLAEGRFAAARLAGVVPPSVAAALELPRGPGLGSGSVHKTDPEALVARTLVDALMPPGAATAGGSAAVQVVEYAAQFDVFHFCSAAVIERVRTLFQQAATAAVAADSATKAAGHAPQVLDVEGDSNDLATVALRLRNECLGWWRLAVEQRTALRIGCPHGTSGDACGHPSCRALRAVADSPQLRAWDAADSAARQGRLGSDANASATARELGHEAVPAAGLELTLGDLGRLAAARLLELTEAYAPAQFLPCQHSVNTRPGDENRGINSGHGGFAEEVLGFGRHNEEVEDAGGVEGAVFHSHALLRARQARLAAGLVEDFVRPHGHTRDRTLSELDRLASGPPTSRPPVVILTGPPYSGRSATLAAFARGAARPAAAGRARRRRPAGALPGLRGAGAGGAADVVAAFFADADAATAMSPSCSGYGALHAAADYLATEVLLQLRGGASLATTGGGGAAVAARRLLCTDAAEQLADAEARLAAACRAGLQAGARMLLLVDGLPPAGLSRLGRLALGLYADAARMCRLAVRHALQEGDGVGGGGGIQLVATGELVPTELREEARSVALEPLTRPEREAICRHWLRRHGLLLDKVTSSGDSADALAFVEAAATAVAAAARLSGLPQTQLQQPESQVASDAINGRNFATDTTGIGNGGEIEDVVAAIVVKREAHLPLFIAAYAHLASRWALSDPAAAHRPAIAGSSGRRLPTALAGRLADAPGTVSGLWQRVVLPSAEARWGRETTRWDYTLRIPTSLVYLHL